MKTFKTNLGIAFDVEVSEIQNGNSITTALFEATCQEGSSTFSIEFKNYGEPVEEYELTEDDCYIAHTWVNQEVVGFIASESAKICVSKDNYWSFSISTLNHFMVTFLSWDNGKVSGTYTATGEEDIYSLVYQLKNV